MCEKKRNRIEIWIRKQCKLISFKNNNLEISFNENLDKDFTKNLTSKLLNWTGERWIILLSKKPGTKSIRELKSQDKNKKFNDLKNTQSYKKAIDLFPDLEVIDIKDVKEENIDWF